MGVGDNGRLSEHIPHNQVGCSLDYDQAWKLLVSVRLAAQCTDARVNVVVEKLYEKFPDAMNLEKVVCNCMNVTSGRIKEAVDSGASTLGDIYAGREK